MACSSFSKKITQGDNEERQRVREAEAYRRGTSRTTQELRLTGIRAALPTTGKLPSESSENNNNETQDKTFP